MHRPTPIDTQSSALKRAAGRVVSFLTPKKERFSPTSPDKSQKPLPSFEPQRLLESSREPHPLPPRPLQREPSRRSLHPSGSRSSLRPDLHSHSRTGSRDTREYRDRSASRGPVISHARSASRLSMRSIDTRWTRDEPYRDPDNRDFSLKRDAEPKEIDGITHWWTNLYLEGRFLGHFFCRQEPRLKPDCFFPGMIIWATHTFFQNNLNATPGDPRIALTRHAPVYVKPRPMVVLYSTDSGLCCAPMFSLDNKGNWNRRQYEYIAITKEGDDWQGETEWAGVLKFRPHPQQRRPLKGRTYISLHQTLYVSTREYVETDLGYLPGDMYNRLIIALDYYQETRKRLAFKHFREEYKNRGMRLVDEADHVREHEGREVSVQNRRMRDYRPERDDDTMVWSLVSGRRVEELISDRSRREDWERLQREPEMLPY